MADTPISRHDTSMAQDLFLKQKMSKGTKELSVHPLEEHHGVI